MPLITEITLPQWFRLMSKMLLTDFGIPDLLYVRSHQIAHIGRIKQCKSKAILSDLMICIDLPLIVRCLGWYIFLLRHHHHGHYMSRCLPYSPREKLRRSIGPRSWNHIFLVLFGWSVWSYFLAKYDAVCPHTRNCCCCCCCCCCLT